MAQKLRVRMSEVRKQIWSLIDCVVASTLKSKGSHGYTISTVHCTVEWPGKNFNNPDSWVFLKIPQVASLAMESGI
jgi:hypothetical protein